MTDWQGPIADCIVKLREEVAEMQPADAVCHAHGIVEAWIAAAPVLADVRRDVMRRAMEEDGFTQADLAHLLGVSRQRVHQLMNTPTTHTEDKTL